ncbi:aspartyl/asparaginyl beta-hydroxylase domain-containing protein [Streptomyces sp. NPDC057555]|uniref:aspartyl/asparaginyl beta-hydroxylase domain-containing protein n=1 Tax=Streptomyces sp. NPDC057555 TaxID=3346166 RepID=UPI00367BB4F9
MPDPTASTTSLRLPDAVRLPGDFDPERLAEDLRSLQQSNWRPQQLYTDSGLGSIAPFDWKVLPLRSVAGAPDRTDPGGAGLAEFADTRHLAHAPYLAEILRGIPAPLRSVRLMALGPGAATRVHAETKYGFPWGTVRLHIPLTTSPGAELLFGDDVYQWQPGTFWFGHFGRPHKVHNTGTGMRVHMVLDCLVTPELVHLFPEDVVPAIDAEVIYARPEVPVTDQELASWRCTFDLPESFANWEEPDGEFLTPQKQVTASVEAGEERPTLFLDGQPALGLVHLGDGEFRFAGWTEERTLQIVPTEAGRPDVVLRSRRGAVVRELRLPAAAK